MAGIEYNFIEKPPKAFQSECPICLQVLREPYQATCCGKSFCKECIEPVTTNNQDCPTCNDKNFNLFHNLGLQQSLNDFVVYCSHKSKGCEWRGELRELDKHLNSDPPADKSLEGCPFTVIKCPLDCDRSCEKGVFRKDVKAHVNDKLLSHVMTQTAEIKTQTAELKSLKQQVQEILAQLNAKLEDVNNEKQHLEQRVTELEEQVNKLTVKQPTASKPAPDQPSASKQPSTYLIGTVKPTGAEFTMTGFEEYKREDDIWYSPHFYTHPGGYKMCLRVDANGGGSGKSTHLSVWICLVRGEFDDQLKWPLRGDITVELLNQEQDKDHYARVVLFNDKAGEKATRVIGKEFDKSGWGKGRFLSLTELRPKYLINDCIKLRIKKIHLL